MRPLPKTTASDYATTTEATQLLNIRPQTLYTYVSRGLVHSISQPGLKERLYLKEDLERLLARSQARRGHGPVAASAMNWGEPIIPTSITEITAQGPKFRGHPAIGLAQSEVSFEAVTELLWKGVLNKPDICWGAPRNHEKILALLRFIDPPVSDEFLEILASVTLHLGLLSGSISQRLSEGNTHAAGREIIQTLTGCFGYLSSRRAYSPLQPDQSIADGLIQALNLKASPHTQEFFRSVLVVLADHELSPGTLAARVAASGGSTVHSCIASAICASSGVKVGRRFDEIDSFLDLHPTAGKLIDRANRLQKNGILAPGFNHPLYPNGDPRGRYLMDLVGRCRNDAEELNRVCEFSDSMQTHHQCYPRHELAMVALMRSLGLPTQTSSALFVLARIAGWVAHVQEQRLSNMLLRPRAKFIGNV